MKILDSSNRIFSQLLDWAISVLAAVIVVGVGVELWGEFSGVSGFFKDVFGIFTTSIPIPFWVAVLLGVALSIFFYRERFSYRKIFSSKK